MVDKQFLCSLAFLTDISQHLNKLNLQLQGKKQTISKIIGFLDRLRKKLVAFKNLIVEKKINTFSVLRNYKTRIRRRVYF